MRRPLLLVLLIAVAASAPPAHAVTASSVAIDHRHLLAWTEGAHLVIRDDRTGERRAFGLGSNCEESSYVADGRDGRFLVMCDRLAVVVHAARGPVKTIETGLSVSYSRIGRHWLEGTDSTSAHLVVVYENWRTGDSHSDGSLPHEDQAAYDLDSRELRRVAFAVPWRSAVDGRWVLFSRFSRGRSTVTLHRRLFNERVGHCARFCDDPSIGSGLALWRDRRTLHGYLLRTGARRRWRLPEDVVVLGANERRIYYARRLGDLLVTARAFRWR